MKLHKKSILSIVFLGHWLVVAPVMAANWVDRTTLSGFFTSRYSQTDEAAFYQDSRTDNGINEDGSFLGTKLGLNIRSEISDKLTIAVQLFSNVEGSDESLIDLDWAFASFMLTDSTTLRTGKIKFPVGFVNEYVDVGVIYPWIQAPAVIYSESFNGPQATRESYSGASLLWGGESDDWSYGTDLFFGQVDLEGMTIKGLFGITGSANWNDTVDVQVSTYQGEMKADDPTTMMGMMMNDNSHAATTVGVKADWNNIIAYAESASVDMDVRNMMGVEIGDSDSWYTTLGYRFGKFLPHYTYQDWERDNGNAHQISTLGVNYSLSSKVVLKFEASQIETDMQGLFDVVPSDDSTNLYSIAIDSIF